MQFCKNLRDNVDELIYSTFEDRLLIVITM